jgi:outer membrane protein assembly factor BamA
MLTPDRSGIEVSITIDEGPRYRIRQLRVYERGPDGKEVDPIDGRRNLRMMVRAKSGDWFNRAELLEDLQAVRTLYRDHGYANVESRLRERRSDAADQPRPRVARGRRRRAGRARTARALRTHRSAREHEDARQGDPSRARGHRG